MREEFLRKKVSWTKIGPPSFACGIELDWIFANEWSEDTSGYKWREGDKFDYCIGYFRVRIHIYLRRQNTMYTVVVVVHIFLLISF